jgi:hypothetical protein
MEIGPIGAGDFAQAFARRALQASHKVSLAIVEVPRACGKLSINLADFYEHAQSESSQQIGLFPRSGISFCVSEIGIEGETVLPILMAGTMQLAST